MIYNRKWQFVQIWQTIGFYVFDCLMDLKHRVNSLTECINIRELGSRIKRIKVRELIAFKSLKFLTIQEINIGDSFHSFIHALWENSFCD